MGKSKPAPPPAPDYAAAATAQGQANVQAGQQTASLNNPNIYGPYGNQIVSYDATGPNGAMQPSIYQTLNPNAQAALDAQQQVQLGQANLGLQGLQQAQGILSNPFQFNGPDIQTSFGGYGNAQTSLPNYGLAQGTMADPGQIQKQLGNYQQAQTSLGNYGSANGQLDLSQLAKMPVNAGVTGQQAIMSRLQPQIDQNNNAYNQQLANQGLTAGGEAYNNAMNLHNQSNNDLYQQAALAGINLDMSANQQGYNQALQTGQFGNAAQQQNYNQALGAGQFANAGIGQNYQQLLGAGTFANAAQQQQYGQNAGNVGLYNAALQQNNDTALQQGGFYNQGQAQNYNQALGQAQFGNTATQQRLQQQLGLYNQPLNQINALMAGSQIQAPQFQQYSGGGQIGAAPIANATTQSGQFAQNLYGQQMAGYNAQMGALGSAVGGIAGLATQPSLGLFGNSLW